jgi:hypothetical protein
MGQMGDQAVGNDLSLEDFQQWVESRKEAGRTIDIETCELGRWAAFAGRARSAASVSHAHDHKVAQLLRRDIDVRFGS